MNGAFKALAFSAALLSVPVSSYAVPGTDGPLKVLLAEADPDSRCMAVKALGAGGGAADREMARLLNDPDPAVRACAIRAAGEARNEFAVEALLANLDDYRAGSGNRGLYEDGVKARLKAIDSVWSLGEIGDPRLMDEFSKAYTQADDIIKINLIVGMGKLKKNEKAGPYIYNIAADVKETEVVRAAAYEMLEHLGYPAPAASRSASVGMEKGDLIFTGGIVGTVSGWVSPDMPVGHSGIFAGTEIKDGRLRVVIADCVPNFFKPGGVRNIYAWHNFTRQYEFPFYGNRTSKIKPTPAQRDQIVKLGLAMGKLGLKYKLFKKGPVEYDCVNYTEFLYEKAGLNPTDNSYESGAGWPFTPWEQFEATRPDTVTPGPVAVSKGGGNAADLELITRQLGSLAGAFGTKAAQPAEVNTDIRPEAAN